MPSSLAASLPGPLPRPLARPAAKAGPGTTAQCVFCHAINVASQVPDIGRGPHCADIAACTERWAAGAKPVSLLPHDAGAPGPLPADGIPALPPAKEAAMDRFDAAHDAEAVGEGGPDTETTPEPAAQTADEAQDS